MKNSNKYEEYEKLDESQLEDMERRIAQEIYRREVRNLGYEPYRSWVDRVWRVREKALDFYYHKYLETVYSDQSQFIAMMKSAQTGATERMVTEAVWLPDQFNYNSIYFLPTASMISDLVRERVDEPLSQEHYKRSTIEKKAVKSNRDVDNVGIKRLSKGFVYFRGSNRPTQITMIPGDAIFVDEVDRMVQENVPYFKKRMQHSSLRWERWASTPTVPNYGIHQIFMETDQCYFYVKCPHCEHWQVLDFFENVEYKMRNDAECEWAKLVCVSCHKEVVPWDMEGEWRATRESERRGYHLSKLYSPFTDLREMVENSKKTSEFELQQFYNQDLGIPYEPKGGRITEEILGACRRDYKLGDVSGPNFMGVDVGTKLHVVIQNHNRIVYIGTLASFSELDDLIKGYDVKVAVVDALPETRKVQELINRFPDRTYMCYYGGSIDIKEGDWFTTNGSQVNTDRTISLDMLVGRFRSQDVAVPKNIDDFTEFKNHMKSMTRIVSRDSKGNQKAEYVQTGPDHYMHAANYSNIAKSMFDNRLEPEVFVV